MFFIKICRRFIEDDGFLKASALAYYSILSIVPILAIAFGIAKGFGFETLLEQQVRQLLGDYPELAAKVIEFAGSLLEHTKGGVVAGAGALFLFFSALKLLHQVEYSFNSIWKIEKGRSLFRMLSDYLAVIFFCPVFFVAGGSLALLFFTELHRAAKWAGAGPLATPLFLFAMKLLPFFFSWLLFFLLFIFIPNRRVPIKGALASALFTGAAYQLLQWGYIAFQTGVSDYNAIYGSFAAFPLFMLWVQISWSLALFGVELNRALSEKKI